MRLDTVSFRKDVKYPRRLPSGYYHGYGGVRPWTSPTRSLTLIKTILIHTTDNPQGNTHYRPEAIFLRDSKDVSSGYVVSSHDDVVAQMMPDEYISWHSGDCADNDFENPTSVGVEIAWTFGKGPLPQIAIDNTSDLVRSLLQKHPSIIKIDMHRAQAIPKGRKPDPLGWADADFYRWRDRMLKERGTPPTPLHSYVALFSTPIFTSRERPDTVALGGQAVVAVGQQIVATDLANGWLHMSDQTGFAPAGAFRLVS